MSKWPNSTPWKKGKRRDWEFENGYKIIAFKHPGSKGFEENKWEITILFKDAPNDPPSASMDNILEDYRKYGTGRYGYLHDPDLDRIVKMVTIID